MVNRTSQSDLPLQLDVTNLNIPALPVDMWHHILQIHTTRMWFQSKCVQEIQTTVHHTVMNFWATTAYCAIIQSDPPTYVDPFEGWSQPHELNAQSLVIHKDKEVTYRLCLANNHVYHGGTFNTLLDVKRSWVQPVEVRGHIAQATVTCHRLYCEPIIGPGPGIVIVNVAESAIPLGSRNCPQSIPKIPYPKQLKPVIMSNSVRQG